MGDPTVTNVAFIMPAWPPESVLAMTRFREVMASRGQAPPRTSSLRCNKRICREISGHPNILHERRIGAYGR
jgi:hypothetical protein